MATNVQKIKKHRCFVEIIVAVNIFIKQVDTETITYEQCHAENNVTLICNFIPRTLSGQYNNVRFVNFKRKQNVSLNSFSDGSWAKVQTIEFNDTTLLDFSFLRKCFQGLISLKELKIHVSSFDLDTDAFLGLHLVHTLDVSKCYRLDTKDLFNSLKAKSALPGLKNLIMSEIGVYKSGHNIINQEEVNYLLPRNLTKIEISETQIDFINISAIFKTLRTLKFFNMSYSKIGNTWGNNMVKKDLSNLNVMDLSYIAFPAKFVPIMPGQYIIANRTGKYSDIPFELKNGLKTLLAPRIMNVSGILTKTKFWVYNCTFTLDEPLDWKVRQLIAKKNNYRHLYIEVVCPVNKFSSVHLLDLSENELEMIYPITCLPNLEVIDLSKNKMSKMLGQKLNLFEKLFDSLGKIRIVKLSNNYLPNLPKNLFRHNKNIETIDLSFNKLEQIHFDIMNLHRLRLLDLRSNLIKILDDTSIFNLNRILRANFVNRSVIMTSNPFLCSTCSCKLSVQWLLGSTLVNTEQQDLRCVTEHKTLVNVDQSAAGRVQTICNRKLVVIISVTSAFLCLITICIISVALYRQRRKLQRKRNLENVICRFVAGEGQYEFVAFLSYSSKDEEFVQDNVINPLNKNLKLMIGSDRNLICTGDQHLRPGFRVHDEIDICLDRVSTVIVIVSNNFCQSSYCQIEFDQAYLRRKPIVLMMLGNVNEELMTPTLKRFYKRDVRILWKTENDQFVLSTTWENICSSILEMVI